MTAATKFKGRQMTLSGKRVVVLGGSSGIGLAVARSAAEDGASVVIASSQQGRVAEALSMLPKGAEGHVVDLAVGEAIEALFETLGAFDHLVFTAGEALALSGLANVSMEQARRFFQLRYWGAYMAAKFGCAGIRSGGSIVFTSGTAGRRPHAGWALGASVCSAMEGLTRALAVELTPIRVNIVCPGVVKTPLWLAIPQARRDAFFDQLETNLLVDHIAEPEEIAQSYLYLMRQTYGTGQVVVVDGGSVLV